MAGGKLRLRVLDEETGTPVAARMTLFRSSGKPAPMRRSVPAGIGAAIDGQIDINLPADTYHFTLSRGPEYHEVRGTFVLNENSDEEKTVRIPRIVVMESENWIAGDPLASIPLEDCNARARAEDLHVVGLAGTNENTENKVAEETKELASPEPLPGIRTDLQRGTGNASDLLLVGLEPQLDEKTRLRLEMAGKTGPSSDFLHEASASHGSGRLVILNSMAWDLPIWVASQQIDGIVVLGEFLRLPPPTLISTLSPRSSTSLPRSTTDWPNSRKPDQLEMIGPQALGKWSVYIYQQLLEAGIQLPPLATSGAGYQPNPIGYSRTYAYHANFGSESNFVTENGAYIGSDWWGAVWAGKTVLTNGPLLRPKLENQAPGHKFHGTSGNPLNLILELQLAIRDPVDYLEVIQDGRVTYKARLDEFARQGGRIPPLAFESSGWAMVHVMTKYEDHYRAAVSAPWFVTIDEKPRISAKAVEFFRDWLSLREQQLAKLPRDQVILHAPYVRAAREFWARQAELANAP